MGYESMQALHSPQVWCTNAEPRSAVLNMKHSVLPETALISFAVALARAAAAEQTLGLRANKGTLGAQLALAQHLCSATEPWARNRSSVLDGALGDRLPLHVPLERYPRSYHMSSSSLSPCLQRRLDAPASRW